jgi:hypothetical protein
METLARKVGAEGKGAMMRKARFSVFVFLLKWLCRVTTADKRFKFFRVHEKSPKIVSVIFTLRILMFAGVIRAPREGLATRFFLAHEFTFGV